MERAPKLSLLGVLLVVGSTLASPAHAELVGEFDVALNGFKVKTGAYTAVFNGRVYDTSGGPGSAVQSAQLRLPRGAKIREELLYGRFICDTVVLEVSLNPSACAGSRFATGTMVLDGRPALAAPVSTSIALFLGPVNIDDVADGGRARIAMFVNGTSTFKTQVLYGTLYRDSGQFSYRLSLPTTLKTIDPNVRLNLAELNLVNPGLVVRRPREGRRPARNVFWSTLPRCSRKRQIVFQIDYQLVDGPPIAKQRTIKCPAFMRRK